MKVLVPHTVFKFVRHLMGLYNGSANSPRYNEEMQFVIPIDQYEIVAITDEDYPESELLSRAIAAEYIRTVKRMVGQIPEAFVAAIKEAEQQYLEKAEALLNEEPFKARSLPQKQIDELDRLGQESEAFADLSVEQLLYEALRSTDIEEVKLIFDSMYESLQ